MMKRYRIEVKKTITGVVFIDALDDADVHEKAIDEAVSDLGLMAWNEADAEYEIIESEVVDLEV